MAYPSLFNILYMQLQIVAPGSEMADSVIKMLLANPNLTGGLLACFLDNTVPGQFNTESLVHVCTRTCMTMNFKSIVWRLWK